MKLMIHAQKTIRDINAEFQRIYPFLKLEFFTVPHNAGRPSPKKDLVAQSTSLIDIRGVLKEGEILICSTESVKRLEQKFQEKFFLSVQVFRKQKHVWLETVQTDFLSLETQNEMGRLASLEQTAAISERFAELE